MNQINELPAKVQAEVRETLKYYTECTVTRWNGTYTVVAATGLDTTIKPADYKVWNFKAADVLTEAEIAEGRAILNNIPESAWA